MRLQPTTKARATNNTRHHGLTGTIAAMTAQAAATVACELGKPGSGLCGSHCTPSPSAAGRGMVKPYFSKRDAAAAMATASSVRSARPRHGSRPISSAVIVATTRYGSHCWLAICASLNTQFGADGLRLIHRKSA